MPFCHICGTFIVNGVCDCDFSPTAKYGPEDAPEPSDVLDPRD